MKALLKQNDSKNIFMILMIVIFGFLFIKTFLPYIDILLLALIIVQVFHPLYSFILKETKNKSLATFLSVLVALFTVLFAVILLILLTYSELKYYIEGNNLTELIIKIQDFINSIINNFDDLFKRLNLDIVIYPINLASINYTEIFKSYFTKIQKDNSSLPQQVLSAGAEVVGNSLFLIGGILFNLFMLLFSLIYLFPNYDNLSFYFNKVSPLNVKINHLLFSKFIKTLQGTIKGTFLVAIIQATVMIIPMLLIGVGAPALLWIIMVVVSIIPIGSGLVWGPVALITIFNGISTGNPIQSLYGILLLIYGTIMVNIIDTALRSNLVKDSLDLHPLITIFSILGGLVLFGFYGVLYGPLIVVIFLTIIETYKDNTIELDDKEINENIS